MFILSIPGMDSWTFWGTVVTDRLKENWQKDNLSGINRFSVLRTWRRQSWSFSLPAMLLTLKVWWKIWRWQSKRMIFAGFDENCKGIKMQIKNTHSVDAVSHPLDQAIVTPQHCCSVVPQSIHGLYITQFWTFVFFELTERSLVVSKKKLIIRR